MKKASLMLVMIAIILLSITLNTITLYIWGYHTIVSSDEVRHFARARQIAYHNVDFYHVWNAPNIYELYPGGLHVFIASFMLTSGDYNAFDLNIILIIMFYTLETFLVFLLGLKISKRVALFSSFFYITFFEIFTDSKTHYIYVFTHLDYVSTSHITLITLFASLIIIFMYFKNSGKHNYRLDILFSLLLIVHGVSHISTYIGYVSNFSFLFIILFFYSLLRGNNKLRLLSLRFLVLIAVSTLGMFLIYYAPMFSDVINNSNYNPYKFLPEILPKFVVNNFYLYLIILIIMVISLYFIIKHVKLLPFWMYGQKVKKLTLVIFVILYILLYILTIFSVSQSPKTYTYDFVLLMGVFPTYIPHNIIGISYVSQYSLFAGFLMFLLSVFGLYLLLKSKRFYVWLLGIIFIIFYLVWIFFALGIKYYANRIIYFEYILPLLLAAGIEEIIICFRKKNERGFSQDNIRHISFRNFLKIAIIIFIIFIFLSISIISVANKDPLLRDATNISNPLRFGKTQPLQITYGFIVVVNYYTNYNEYVLGSKNSIEPLAATTHIKPPDTTYVNYYKKNNLWYVVILPLRNPTKDNLNRYLKNYPTTRYLVVSYKEVFPWGARMPVEKYDSSPYLLKTYESNGGQRLYLIVNT